MRGAGGRRPRARATTIAGRGPGAAYRRATWLRCQRSPTRRRPAFAYPASTGICIPGVDRHLHPRRRRVLADGPILAAAGDGSGWPPTIQATALPGHATVAPPWDQPTIRPAGNRHARQPPTRDNHQPPIQEVHHPPTAGSHRNLHQEVHHPPTAGSHRNLHQEVHHPPKAGSCRNLHPETHYPPKAGSRHNLSQEIRQRSAPGNRHQEPRRVHSRGRRRVRRRPVARRRKRKS